MISNSRTLRLARNIRMGLALALIALEFTGLFPFLTMNAKQPLLHVSPYTVQIATMGVAAFILVIDFRSLRRLIEKPVFRWVFASLILFTWGMLVRTFYAPAGITPYDFFRAFGLQVCAIVFLTSCVVIFDDPDVLCVTKRAVALATILGISFNLYVVFYPGTFGIDTGRAAGLYADPNYSGMALVFGCLIGFGATPRRWREFFLLATAGGVVATFSRESLIALVVVVAGATLAGAVSLRRLVVEGVLVVGLFLVLNLPKVLRQGNILSPDNLGRLTLETSDVSARGRLQLAEKAFAQFEAAPLLGQGFGTTGWWTEKTQSHNLYLSLLADLGILGILLIPALMFSLRRKAWDFYTFAIVFMVWPLFFHMALTVTFSLISLAIEADEAGDRLHPGLLVQAPSAALAEGVPW
jgi:O-antigen ligase